MLALIIDGNKMNSTIVSLFLFVTGLAFSIHSHATSVEYKQNFLVISDIHLDQRSTHAMEISPKKMDRDNDLDSGTFVNLLSEIENNINKGIIARPKFILILGDIVGHTRSSTNSVAENEHAVFRALKDKFPTTPILYTFGNNDGLKINYGPFTDVDRKGYKSPYEVAKYASGWEDGFLSTGLQCTEGGNEYPCIITEDTQNGYYSVFLESHLRLISLNTVLFSTNRKQISTRQTTVELDWLNNQLDQAKSNDEKVLITMHVPPGNNTYDHSNFWASQEQTNFLKIISNYHNTILAMLASHTHTEELRIIKDHSQKTVAGVYLVAGLSTSHGNEPSVKTFYLNQQDRQWQLSNYETFHFSFENSQLSFNKLYDYVNYYCNNQETDLLQCLDSITASKIDNYLAAGNRYYKGGTIQSLKDVILTMSE